VQPQDAHRNRHGCAIADLKPHTTLNSQNAIIVRRYARQVVASRKKMIRDIDKAKPEVVVQVEVLQARTDRLAGTWCATRAAGQRGVTPGGTTTTTTAAHDNQFPSR